MKNFYSFNERTGRVTNLTGWPGTLFSRISLVPLHMSLEQDIRQEKFISEFQKAALNILYTSGWLYNTNAARLKPHGITPEQFNVLRILRGSHPKKMMLADITGRMLDKNSNATRLVEKLRQKGLVERQICERNRRQVDISITDKGLSILKIIDNEEEEWLGRMTAISPTEAQELNRILDKLRG
jgi:DNA-binding MarR family transcriptional regulator